MYTRGTEHSSVTARYLLCGYRTALRQFFYCGVFESDSSVSTLSPVRRCAFKILVRQAAKTPTTTAGTTADGRRGRSSSHMYRRTDTYRPIYIRRKTPGKLPGPHERLAVFLSIVCRRFLHGSELIFAWGPHYGHQQGACGHQQGANKLNRTPRPQPKRVEMLCWKQMRRGRTPQGWALGKSTPLQTLYIPNSKQNPTRANRPLVLVDWKWLRGNVDVSARFTLYSPQRLTKPCVSQGLCCGRDTT